MATARRVVAKKRRPTFGPHTLSARTLAGTPPSKPWPTRPGRMAKACGSKPTRPSARSALFSAPMSIALTRAASKVAGGRRRGSTSADFSGGR